MSTRKNDIGRRISTARKAAQLSQRQVAELLEIPTRTYSYYESPQGDLPSSLLEALSDILDIDIRELLGVAISEPVRRGPRSIVEQRAETIHNLPKKDQRFVVKFLDQVLDDYQRRHKKGRERAKTRSRSGRLP